jgi:mono/diheme cytochrome c family protein
MRKRFTIVALALGVWTIPGMAADKPAAAAAAAPKVTYQDHILPIFRNTCLNCHNPDKKKGGLDLSTYVGISAGGGRGKTCEPGDPDSS